MFDKWQVGIDPGYYGGISFINIDAHVAFVLPTPLIITKKKIKGKTKTNKKFNIPEMVNLMSKFPVEHVMIEQVSSHPGEGVSGVFNFGYGVGLWHGIIGALNIHMSLVTPQKWKKYYNLHTNKNESRATATELMPLCQPYWKLVKNDGLAEAMLINIYHIKTQTDINITDFQPYPL